MASPAGERTEKPTPKRLRDARERGQLARSRDLSAALSLAGVTISLAWFAVRITSTARDRLAAGLSMLSGQAHAVLEPSGLATSMWSDATLLASMAGPPALVAGLVSILASLAQSGFAFSHKAVRMNWTALSPSQGFQRFAPMQSLPELGKALLALAAIGSLGYVSARTLYTQAPLLMAMTPAESVSAGWDLVWRLLWQSSLALCVLGGADYFMHRWRLLSQLKMTRQEVKDEARMQEGNPEIKARVRRVQREMARKRMLHAVKTATVVITNPTHYAVALSYTRERMAAPVVVAKGQNELAARIRAVAREHGVPIVENVALARALHKTAEVGDAIPATLFGAVAEVLAYLVRLKQLVL